MFGKVLVALTALAALTPVNAIWPIPQQISTGNGILFVDKSIKVTYNDEPISNTALKYRATDGTGTINSKEIVRGGIQRSLKAIFDQGLVPWMINPPRSNYEPAVGGGNGMVKSLTITQTGNHTLTGLKGLAVDESYSLHLTLTGEASIEAATPTGVLWALETFTQLFFKHSSGTASYTKLAPVKIEDAPKFPYRGLLLDLGRHWFSVQDIKRQIDAMAMNKMNIVHLHITEASAWPLEIPALPELAEKLSFAPGLTYSPQDITDIQEHGLARGVQAILEIDMPGHVDVEQAYPGLTVAHNKLPWSRYCASPPCGALKLNNTDVEKFVSTLFDDLLPRLNPYTSIFHTGGDEYKAANSKLDPNLNTEDKTVLRPMVQRFVDHAHNKVREHGLTPMIWEEIVANKDSDDWAAKVGKDTVIQAWLGPDSVKKLAAEGYKVVDSSDEFYYLDCGRGAWTDEHDSNIKPDSSFTDWCSPTRSWRRVYNHDPLSGVPDANAKNVLGGEVCVWTETIDATTLDGLVWPRAAAAGEVWWSGRQDGTGKLRSIYTARPRLGEQRERMLARGVRGATITPQYCQQSALGACT